MATPNPASGRDLRPAQAARHSSTGHNENCFCGSRATAHIAYGSGCGTACKRHATSIKKTKRAATVTPLPQ